MSILIKNMDMPKSCMYCPLNYDCISCEVNHDVDFDFEGYDKERHKDCPLVEIPPHGDLIDRDALMKQCEMGGNCNTCEHSSYGIWCDKGNEFVNVCEAISDAPTIIEAEV